MDWPISVAGSRRSLGGGGSVCGDGGQAGQDAEVAACDALAVPVVTGRADMTVIDRLIALATAAPAGDASPEARQAHRYAIARLAVDFVSGPGGLASALRTGLLGLEGQPSS
jgi:hypothetical protein